MGASHPWYKTLLPCVISRNRLTKAITAPLPSPEITINTHFYVSNAWNSVMTCQKLTLTFCYAYALQHSLKEKEEK